MPDRFAREKEQILSHYIIHHEVDESEVATLADRLDRAVARAEILHAGQKRKTGEDYIWHPLHTAMEVSRFGRIVDWAAVEAAILHDTLEDTHYTFQSIEAEFPESAKLVLALTKIKDNRVHTYQRLFEYVLKDVRVLLVKLADRLDNLATLPVFRREKQVRIARESAEMYANICRRLCMTDLAERLTEEIGPILNPDAVAAFRKAQDELRDGWARPLEDLRGKLADLFPGDFGARIDLRWNRFRPDVLPLAENLLTVRVIAENNEDAYRALGRIHLAFRALPGTFSDTLSAPRKNGYRALDTRVAYQGRILSFHLTSAAADRFNRLGVLAMDITSPRFNMEYLDDLREFLQNEEMDIQDFLRFHRPDALQVVTPQGDVMSMEEGATALDFAFAVHEKLGLRAVSAIVNGVGAELSAVLRPGDRVEIVTALEPVADDRYLGWAHSRKALSRLRRYMNRREAERAALTGREWLLEAAEEYGIPEESADAKVRERAVEKGTTEQEIYRRICLGNEDIAALLGTRPAAAGRRLPGSAILQRLRGREGHRRKVMRYEFDDPHIRFCPICAPVEGDDIEGVPEAGRLLVHRLGCTAASSVGKVPLAWEKRKKGDLWDPGPMELEVRILDEPGVLYAILLPFRDLGVDIRDLSLPTAERGLRVVVQPGSDRTLNSLIRGLRKLPSVAEIRVFRAREDAGVH